MLAIRREMVEFKRRGHELLIASPRPTDVSVWELKKPRPDDLKKPGNATNAVALRTAMQAPDTGSTNIEGRHQSVLTFSGRPHDS